MSLLHGLFGNASNMSNEEAQSKYGYILGNNEQIEVSYKLVRDMIIFTNRRLIFVDLQGITGRKVEVKSIPYRSITQFAVETAGHLDFDAELKITVSGQDNEIKKRFNKNVNIYEVQAILTEAIINYSK